MRAALFICAAFLAAAASLLAHQEKKKDNTDKPVITVAGCVDGSWLHVQSTDPIGSTTERYRLVGPKQLLKEIGAQYKGHVIEVTGPVESLLQIGRPGAVSEGRGARISTRDARRETLTTRSGEAAAPGASRGGIR